MGNCAVVHGVNDNNEEVAIKCTAAGELKVDASLTLADSLEIGSVNVMDSTDTIINPATSTDIGQVVTSTNATNTVLGTTDSPKSDVDGAGTINGRLRRVTTDLAAMSAKLPTAIGQQLVAASMAVVLPATQITTLTPPAAITGFATETTLGTRALETGGNLAAAAAVLGTTADAAATQGSTGSMSAKLRYVTGILGSVQADTSEICSATGATTAAKADVDGNGSSNAHLRRIGYELDRIGDELTTGASYFRSIDLDETEEDVKTTAGRLLGGVVMNLATTVRYLKIYNATAANVTVGTTTPVLTIPIPTAGTANGAGFVLPIPECGVAFSTAICVAATTGIADNDTGAPGANEVVVNLFYK